MGSIYGAEGIITHIGGVYSEDATSAVSPAWGDENEIGFLARTIDMYTGGMGITEEVELSIDGANVFTRLDPATVEANKSIDMPGVSVYYVRSASGGQIIHVEAR